MDFILNPVGNPWRALHRRVSSDLHFQKDPLAALWQGLGGQEVEVLVETVRKGRALDMIQRPHGTG